MITTIPNIITLFRIATVPVLILLGVWGATLSSAIGSILVADLAAVAGDRYNYGVGLKPVNVFIDEAAEVADRVVVNSEATRRTTLDSAPWLDPERITRVAKGVDVERFARATDDWRALVHDPAVDAIVIATPQAYHREIAEAAKGNGIRLSAHGPYFINLNLII